MIVSESAQVLFVHVQKTGGTSIARLLLDHVDGACRDGSLRGDKHATLPTILKERPHYSEFFIVGFVRNPWARMLSWYSMVERRSSTPGMLERNAFWRGVAASCPDFESFVMRGTEEFSRLRRPQIDYLRYQGRRADFIGRTERLAQDVAAVADRLGVPQTISVERRNSAPPRTYQDAYTPAMRDRVGDLYAPDLRTFGYSFD